MTPHPIRQRCLPKMPPPPFAKRKLNIILPLAVDLAQRPHTLRHIHLLKLCVVAHALEERYAVAHALTRARTQHPVRRRAAHAARQGFEALPHGHHQRALNRLAVDPLALLVLHLQSALRRSLEQVTRQHGVFVWAHALAVERVVAVGRRFGILDDLQLVLLVGVEEAVKGGGRHAQCLGDQRGEENADAGHALHVVFEDGLEVWEVLLRWPLVWREEVMIEGCFGSGYWMRCREIELLAVVRVARCGLVV